LQNGDFVVPFDAMGENDEVLALTAQYSPVRDAFAPAQVCTADANAQISYGDAKLAALPDGRLLALIWAFETATDTTLAVQRCVSDDNGRSWSPPQPTNLCAQITVPLALGDGNVIAASNVRTAPDGIFLLHSRDEGMSWDTTAPIRLWNPHEKRISGEVLALQDGESGAIWEALPGFAFGHPDLVALDDSAVLLTYYAQINDIFHIRACRFRVEL
jgi:hypothetical protein